LHAVAGAVLEAGAVRHRVLGSSGITVSELALGSWLTFGDGIAADVARACVERALDRGVTLIDTANVYGRGAAEELLGSILAGRERSSYVLATKLYFPMPDGGAGLSREQVRMQLEASLRRLRTDHVDLYQCHRFDRETPLEETLEALTEAVRAGKVRALGFSEWSPPQIRQAVAVPGVEPFSTSQPQYSLLRRAPERDVFPLCAEHGIAQLAWSPLGQGVLTGKYRPGEAVPKDSRAGSERMGWALGKFLRDDVLAAVQRLRPVAEAAGLTLAQLALAWVLRDPRVAAAIVGASRPEQLDETLAASGVRLDAATIAAAEAAVADVGEA
jgi:aryl-alcohol dehydrogenase-like predicted oxidoreductase